MSGHGLKGEKEMDDERIVILIRNALRNSGFAEHILTNNMIAGTVEDLITRMQKFELAHATFFKLIS